MAADSNGENGRDMLGRFAHGNPGGPGNPFARRLHAYRAALKAACSPEDVGDVIRALLEKAKQGDAAAAKLVFERVMGKVPEVPLDVFDRDPEVDAGEAASEQKLAAIRLSIGQP
jgi:hypothetical protein